MSDTCELCGGMHQVECTGHAGHQETEDCPRCLLREHKALRKPDHALVPLALIAEAREAISYMDGLLTQAFNGPNMYDALVAKLAAYVDRGEAGEGK